MPSSLNLSVRKYREEAVLDAVGVVATDTTPYLQRVVSQIIVKKSLILNVEKVTLCTSSGVRTLFDLSQAAKLHGNRLILLWPTEELISLSEDIGYYGYFTFAGSLDEAVMKIELFT